MYSHTATQRVLLILECLGDFGALSIEELVEKTTIPYSTVYRILITCTNLGYMEKVEPKKFKLSTKLFRNIALNSSQTHTTMAQSVHPHLQKLAYLTKETIHLGILSDNKVLYIDKIDSQYSLRMHSFVGFQADLHCTGIGKVLISWMGDDLRPAILRNMTFKKYTDNTIINKKEFLAHIVTIQQQGYAIDNEEHEAHLICLAMPIFNAKNYVVAAVSISIPIIRYTTTLTSSIFPMLRQCAEQASKSLMNTNYQNCLNQYSINK